jgi:hypothetical protein
MTNLQNVPCNPHPFPVLICENKCQPSDFLFDAAIVAAYGGDRPYRALPDCRKKVMGYKSLQSQSNNIYTVSYTHLVQLI